MTSWKLKGLSPSALFNSPKSTTVLSKVIRAEKSSAVRGSSANSDIDAKRIADNARERRFMMSAKIYLNTYIATILEKEAGMGVEKFMSLRVMGCTKRRVCAWSAMRWIGELLAP